ncbi:MAG TPA: hypothetical protein VF532_23935 [Candidatus Angelobacter sp.]
MKKVLLLAVALLSAIICSAQTQPNLENGWKPFGSYDGSHLDTVNLMNGNVMLHAPLTPDTPQRGSLLVRSVLYASSKDWQVVCVPGQNGVMQCSWQKGGTGVGINLTPSLTVHRTINKQYTNAQGSTTYAWPPASLTVSAASPKPSTPCPAARLPPSIPSMTNWATSSPSATPISPPAS